MSITIDFSRRTACRGVGRFSRLCRANGRRFLQRRVLTVRLVSWALLLAFAQAAGAKIDIPESQVKGIAAMLPAKPAGVGRPITDRAAWNKLAHRPGYAAILSDARKLAQRPVPALSDDLFLDYSRTGNRDRCQKVLFARSDRLATFTLAECLEHQGWFIKPLAETIAALCAERTWVYPAHDGALSNFYGRTVEMDLRATRVAWELATADSLLGDTLLAETRRLIRDNVERRVLQPYRDMVEGRRKEIRWLRVLNNWNAVCLAGVTGAALALEESPEQRAWFIAAAEHYIRYFLKGFTSDGYCSEGLGYWNYGFGHFVMLGETIRQATGGRIDLLAEPAAFRPALFASRDEILNEIYPTIADCHPGTRPNDKTSRYLTERLGLPLTGNRDEIFLHPTHDLISTTLYDFLPHKLPSIRHADLAGDSPLRTWFADAGVLICRPTPGSKVEFAAALKGGNNGENHNHNDVGSFSVVSGKAMVICDPGAEVYTRRTFSAKRYESKVLNSFGHAVPVIAGHLQRTGRNARAVVLRTDFSDAADTLALDIRSAYAVPELKKVERTFTFHRAAPVSLVVQDDVEFSDKQTFETALITWSKWKRISPGELLISNGADAIRATIDTGGRSFTLKSEILNEDVYSASKPVRIGISLDAPVEGAVVTLTLSPAKPEKAIR
jgi:Heparinase II/III-like protein